MKKAGSAVPTFLPGFLTDHKNPTGSALRVSPAVKRKRPVRGLMINGLIITLITIRRSL